MGSCCKKESVIESTHKEEGQREIPKKNAAGQPAISGIRVDEILIGDRSGLSNINSVDNLDLAQREFNQNNNVPAQ